jgi:hypothetical protein
LVGGVEATERSWALDRKRARPEGVEPRPVLGKKAGGKVEDGDKTKDRGKAEDRDSDNTRGGEEKTHAVPPATALGFAL